MQIRTAVKLKNIVSVRVIISKNCLIDTGTEVDFNKAGIFLCRKLCVRESFNCKLICRRARYNETFEVTEEINHLLHCARIETFELNEDKIVSNHISSDNANLLVDGINHHWHRPF